MGNSSSDSLDKVECISLKKFQEETPRKMTIHVLSNDKKNCKSFVEILSHEKFPTNCDVLLEKNITKKINLYSFMNYIVYDSAKVIMECIKIKSRNISDDPKSNKVFFSEVVVVLNNDLINDQINTIKQEINDEPFDDVGSTLKLNPYYFPFLIFISPNNLDLTKLIAKKTFQYKISLEDILNFNNKDNKEVNTNEILALFRKLNVLFSYYNELGDVFAFKNSEGEEVRIQLEDDTNITVFINTLFLGRTGAGKSTLINLLLDEKKSLEGGTGFSTTTKNILVYKKSNIPLRFYDVKGIENEETLQNYANILKKYNGKDSSSKDVINAIIYCLPYKNKGTVIEEMENKLFEKLVDFEIPILFVLTSTPYDPDKEKGIVSDKTKAREGRRKTIEKAIKSLMINIIIKKKKKTEEDAEKFLENFVKIYYVNLVRDYDNELPPFGVDKLMSFFTKSVPIKDWEGLEKSCFLNEEENCKKYCEKNPFLKAYSDFEKLKVRNKGEALDYLKGLKAAAFFSGWIPGVDIGMEYFYRKKFKAKCKSLYGFDYDRAQKFFNEQKDEPKNNEQKDEPKNNEKKDEPKNNEKKDEPKNNEKKDEPKKIEYELTQKDFDERSENINLEERKIEEEIDEEINNTGRNTGAIIRGAGEIGGIVIKALPTAAAAAAETTIEAGVAAGTAAVEAGAVVVRASVSAGLKIAGWVLLPITLIGFGAWSCYNIHKDCHKILDIFDNAFTPLKFETLNAYSKSFQHAIIYLENIWEKILEDDK